MGPIAIRRELHRHRRRLATVVAMVVCSTAIAAHHSGMAMADGHHDAGMGAAAEMCLAAFTAVGAAVVAIVVGLIALGRWRPPLRIAPSALWLSAGPPLPRARAGPGLLLVLCVSRR